MIKFHQELAMKIAKEVTMKYLPDFGSLARREMVDKIVLDILHHEVSRETIETAMRLYDEVGIEIENYDFIHFIAGGDPTNLNALNELAMEALMKYLEGGDDYDGVYDN